MAILNFGGCEEAQTEYMSYTPVGGALTSSTTQKRTGTRSYRIVNSAAAGYGMMGKPSTSTLIIDQLGRSAETFFTFYLMLTSLPSANAEVAFVGDTTPAAVVSLKVDNAGVATLVGATTSSTIATLSASTWYRVDIRCTKNGTSYCKINGGTEQSCTANDLFIQYLGFGSIAAATFTAYYDDFVIDDAAFPTYEPMVIAAQPNAAGTYTGWTDGTGNTYAEVDDRPPDEATTYIQNTAGSSVASTFRFESAATAGVIGTIKGVMPVIVGAEASSTTTQVGIRVRSGGTDYDTATPDLGSTSYTSRRIIHLTDPATSAAWTTAGFDAIEIGALKGADTSSVRVTAIYAMVLSDSVATTTITAVGAIATAEAHGTQHFKFNPAVTAIASSESFGTASINQTVVASSIATAESIGSLTIAPIQAVLPTAIVTEEIFGTAVITPGSVTISPSSIATAESIGAAIIGRSVFPSTISSDESFGTPALKMQLYPSAIATAEAFGTASVQRSIHPSAIGTSYASGTAVLTVGSVTISPSSIDTEESIGDHVVTAVAVAGGKTPPSGYSAFAPRLSAGSAVASRRPPTGGT